MSSIELNYLNLDSINSLNADRLSSLEMNAKEDSKTSQNQLYLSNVLLLMTTQLSQVQKEGRKISKANLSTTPSLCSSSSPTASPNSTSSSTSTGSSTAPTTQPMANSSSNSGDLPVIITPVDVTIPDDYDDAERGLESLISFQAGNWNQFSDMIYLLEYMIGFAEKFPSSPVVTAQTYTKLEAALVINLIATIFVNSGGDQALTNQAIATVSGLFGGNIPSEITPYMNYAYYSKNYTYDGTHVITQQELHFYEVNTLFNATPSKLLSGIYKDEINRIMDNFDEATFLEGDFEIYIQLAGVILQKEGDTQNEIASCANMLQELSTGATYVGNAEDAFSQIVKFDINNPTLIELNTSLDDIEEGFEYTFKALNITNDAQFKTYLIGTCHTTEAGANAIVDLHDILEPIYKINNAIQWSSIDSATQHKILTDLTTINNTPSDCNTFIMLTNTVPSYDIKLINDYDNNTPTEPLDEAKILAQYLLGLRQMGQIYDSTIFPGLGDITSKLLGNSENPSGGDFFSVTGISLDQLIGAAQGNTADEQAIVDGIGKIVPIDADGETEGLSTINNELNEMATYFDDHNQAETTNVQTMANNDEKMLSFIKELYDQPTKFIKSIQSNLQQSAQ